MQYLRIQPVTMGMLQVPFSKHDVICAAGFLGMYPLLHVTVHVPLNVVSLFSPQWAGFNIPLSGFLNAGQWIAAFKTKKKKKKTKKNIVKSSILNSGPKSFEFKPRIGASSCSQVQRFFVPVAHHRRGFGWNTPYPEMEEMRHYFVFMIICLLCLVYSLQYHFEFRGCDRGKVG